MAKYHENLLKDSTLALLFIVKFFSSLEAMMVLKLPNKTFLRITRYHRAIPQFHLSDRTFQFPGTRERRDKLLLRPESDASTNKPEQLSLHNVTYRTLLKIKFMAYHVLRLNENM